jgi:hypothetical protein
MDNEIFSRKDQLYKQANQFWMYGLHINFGVFALFLTTVFINWPPLVWFLGLLSLLAPIALFVCNSVSGSKFKAAEKCRRILHYSDGLGMAIPEIEVACILGEKSKKNFSPSVYTNPYYFTKAKPGVIRLLRNTRECAYFTFKQCNYSKLWSLLIISVMAVSAIVIFYVVTTSKYSQSDMQALARSAVAIVSFLFTANIILTFIKYWQTEIRTEEVYKSINSALKSQNISIEEAMIMVDNYNVIISQGPLIFYKIYDHYREALNDGYRKAHNAEEE